jgi:osmotically-inducible protein OsmY
MPSSPKRFWASTLVAAPFVAAALVGCAATPDRESTGVFFDDATVTSKVKAELIEDPLTKARDISVTTDQGVVQLYGFIDSKEQGDEAVRLANSIPGVRSVDNELQLHASQ